MKTFLLAVTVLFVDTSALVLQYEEQVVMRVENVNSIKHIVQCPKSKPQHLYRLFNPDIEHSYLTTDPAHLISALADGYELDGIAASIFPSPEPSTVPLYHLYNERSQIHFFTHSAAERDAAIVEEGFEYNIDQPVAGYLYARRVCGSRPLWRLVREGYHGLHRFYTADPRERDAALVNDGYVDAVIAGYVH